MTKGDRRMSDKGGLGWLVSSEKAIVQLIQLDATFTERIRRVIKIGDLENFVSAQSGLAVWSRARFTMEYLISIFN